MLVTPTQPRQTLHHLLRVPHFQVFDVHANFHRFADQSARHRVNVSIEVNQAAAVHTRWHPLARFQSPRRQSTQLRQLLRQTLPSARVELLQQPFKKIIVVLSTRKISAATQHQRLIDRLLEAMVPLLDVAILIAMIRLDLLRRQVIVGHHNPW